jgi:hypothetical protein
MKICQTVNNSTTTEARENITTDLGSLELKKVLVNFRKKCHNKSSHRFLVTTKLFSEQNIPNGSTEMIVISVVAYSHNTRAYQRL